MILGMSPLLFVHVVVSLIGIATGCIVLYGLLVGRPHGGWTAAFLVTTILTSLTGFPLPATQLLPSHIVGIISIVLLAVAVAALYLYRARGRWRWIYVASAIAAFYLNVFVGVVQSFRHVAFLTLLAPTESETPFVAAQAVVLVLFVVLGVRAARRFQAMDLSASRLG
jgi:hypothetical protein